MIIQRFLRFCFVGSSGVIVDMTMLYLLADATTLGWPITSSKICSTEIAMLNNFVWNDLWTFRGLADGQIGAAVRLARFGKYNIVCLGGLTISVAVIHMLTKGFGMNLYVANLIAIFTATAWNFWMNYAHNWKGSRRFSEHKTASI